HSLFYTDPPTPPTYPLSLHDALPISPAPVHLSPQRGPRDHDEPDRQRRREPPRAPRGAGAPASGAGAPGDRRGGVPALPEPEPARQPPRRTRRGDRLGRDARGDARHARARR